MGNREKMSKISKTKLDALRGEIDEFDRQLLAVLESRLALATSVAASKGDAPHFRPGREAMILNQLAAESSLDAGLIEGIWRQILSASLTRQSRLRLVMCAGDSDLMPMIRWRFGLGADVKAVASHEDALESLRAGAGDLAILPHWDKAPWQVEWMRLLRGTTRVWLASVAPFFTNMGANMGADAGADVGIAPIALFTTAPPDVSDFDWTLIWQDGRYVEQQGRHLQAPQAVGVFQKAPISDIKA